MTSDHISKYRMAGFVFPFCACILQATEAFGMNEYCSVALLVENQLCSSLCVLFLKLMFFKAGSLHFTA